MVELCARARVAACGCVGGWSKADRRTPPRNPERLGRCRDDIAGRRIDLVLAWSGGTPRTSSGRPTSPDRCPITGRGRGFPVSAARRGGRLTIQAADRVHAAHVGRRGSGIVTAVGLLVHLEEWDEDPGARGHRVVERVREDGLLRLGVAAQVEATVLEVGEGGRRGARPAPTGRPSASSMPRPASSTRRRSCLVLLPEVAGAALEQSMEDRATEDRLDEPDHPLVPRVFCSAASAL